MKVAQQLAGTASALSPNVSTPPTTHVIWSFDSPETSVPEGGGEPLSAVTDGDLSRAAYSQAVALYDSCVQRAAARTPQLRQATPPKEPC